MEKFIKAISVDKNNRIAIYRKMRSGGWSCYVPVHEVRYWWTFWTWSQNELLLVNWERVHGLYSIEECEKKAEDFIYNYRQF